jgi:glucokinase
VCSEHTYDLRGTSHAPIPDAENAHFSTASFCRLVHTLGIAAAKAAAIDVDRITGAALAMPGPFDYENGISQMRHKLQPLFGFDLKAALATRFHWQPAQIRFLNDAAAFLLGESGAGAAKGFDRAIGLTLGTGIGASFAIHGRIAPSDPANTEGVPPGGEIWNLPYNNATVEDFLSTRYLRQHYQDLTGLEAEVAEVAAIAECHESQPCAPLDQAVKATAGHTHTTAELVAKEAKAGPARARQVFHDFGHHLGLVLNQHAAPFHPDVIVLGGGIARAANLFLPTTRKALAPGFTPKIAISTLMEEAPLAGAGVHWFTTNQQS